MESFSTPHYTQKTDGLLVLPPLPLLFPLLLPQAPNLPARHSADQTGEHQASCSTPPATPRIKHHSPGQTDLLPPKKKLNNKQQTEN
jgi:hypothetical protein